MARRRRHSRKSMLHGFFDPKNKWVWAGVGAAAVVAYIYRDKLFGADKSDKSMAGLGYAAPTYDLPPTLQGLGAVLRAPDTCAELEQQQRTLNLRRLASRCVRL